jgi:CheY-like chemotaxis protein
VPFILGSVQSFILVADDDDDVRESVALVLREEGYSVTVCPGGREALDCLRTSGVAPFLVLLDLMMPGVAGWDVLRAMGEDVRLAAIPVCIFSGSADLNDLARTAHVLPKPVSVESLLDAVRKYAPA